MQRSHYITFNGKVAICIHQFYLKQCLGIFSLHFPTHSIFYMIVDFLFFPLFLSTFLPPFSIPELTLYTHSVILFRSVSESKHSHVNVNPSHPLTFVSLLSQSFFSECNIESPPKQTSQSKLIY